MKNFKIKIAAIGIMALFIFAACLPEDAKELQKVQNVKVTIQYDASQFKKTAYANKQAILHGDRRNYTVMTNADGVADFADVIPGEYRLTVSEKLPKEEYGNMINPPLGANDVLVNGAITNMVIYEDYTAALKLQVGVSQSLVISKVYYSAVKDDNNKSYRNDIYFEIYNNSDMPVSTENLYAGLTETESTPYFFEERMENIYMTDLFKFAPQMLAPGASILVAKQAKNHQETAAVSPDLSEADYETKSVRVTPNDNVPGIEHVYRAYSTRDYLFMNYRGDIHLTIFRYAGDVADLEKKQKPTATKPTFPWYAQIKVAWILDGIDIVKFSKGNPVLENKRLPQGIDASYQTTPNGVYYKGYSLDRKVTSVTDDGRFILQDTNNSLEDFAACTDNTPRKYDKPELLTNDE